MPEELVRYRDIADLPATIPIFPLAEALVLPRSNLPLNIFEPRYVQMIDAAMSGPRIIGMVQPSLGRGADRGGEPALEQVGCAGRITSYAEQGDGRYLVSLTGIARFRIVEELAVTTRYRQVRPDFSDFAGDLVRRAGEEAVDRARVLKTLADYLEANNLTTDWDAIASTDTEQLVNALSMMSPFGAREKQALLEADGLGSRSQVLIALTEMSLAQQQGASGGDGRLQ